MVILYIIIIDQNDYLLFHIILISSHRNILFQVLFIIQEFQEFLIHLIFFYYHILYLINLL